jgi:hypothetical protein
MGDHDYHPTCLSDIEHGHPDNVRDVVLHYFGCLRETEREEYYRGLPPHKQQRIEKERKRIKEQRALFEAEEQTKDFVRKFKTSLSQWKPGHTRAQVSDTHVKLTKENAWGMNAYAVFFRNSEKYSDTSKLCFDQFPNQKIAVKDLLYNKNKDMNPLMRPCEDNEIRYFHLPGNNMEWVEVGVSFPPPPITLNFALGSDCTTLQRRAPSV